MIEITYGKKFLKPLVLALGFFDSIHKGHRQIIAKAVKEAEEKDCLCAVMTFKNNPYDILGGNIKLVYSYEERLILLNKIGVDAVLCAEFDNEYKNITPLDFLNKLTESTDLRHIVCGYDFRYGKYGKGNIDTLKDYCINKNIGLDVISEEKLNGIRISSTAIREELKKGNINAANVLLGDNYFIKGTVVSGRKIGSKLLYPTININADEDKLSLKQGVYATMVEIDGVKYNGVTNCGGKPTFDDIQYNTETHIIGYSGNLYSKQVIIYFYERLRDIKKFANADELKEQIKKDIERAKETIND